jgi:hypothetical protein
MVNLFLKKAINSSISKHIPIFSGKGGFYSESFGVGFFGRDSHLKFSGFQRISQKADASRKSNSFPQCNFPDSHIIT